jgi:NADPH-dependent 2,4-dienoyl-CoA reductase/sulfur reductase-like enzyme
MQTLAIIGASLAGLSAARAARAHGFAGRLVIIGQEPERPYDRPPLSKDFLLGRLSERDLFLETSDDGLEAQWLLGTRAVALDGAARTVTLEDGQSISADGMVIATGAGAREIPGIAGMANVFTLRSIGDARGLAAEMGPGRSLVVIGAGFIGAEVASAARSLGMQVTMVSASTVPFTGPFGEDAGRMLAGLHRAAGVDLVCGQAVETFHTRDGRVSGVQLSGGRHIAADVVVVGIGATPSTEWLAGSGLALSDGILCDASGRTSIPGIVAAGDCAAWFDPVEGRHHRSEHWTAALEQSGIAVSTLLDGPPSAELRKAPYFWSDQHGVKIQFAGCRSGADRVHIEAGDRASCNILAVYYRGEAPVAVLGMNQPRLFTRWRRQLAGIPTEPDRPAFASALPGAVGPGAALPAHAPMAS